MVPVSDGTTAPDLVPRPTCAAHGSEVAALVRGELEGAAAARAEQALASCRTCAAWHEASLSIPAVAEGVAAGLAAFRPPGTAPAIRRLATAAAALVLVCGGLAAWRLADPSPRPVQTATAGDPARGDAGPAAAEPRTQRRDSPGGETIFEDRLETADLSAWSGMNRSAPVGKP
jgi:hypothetical protein